MPNAPKMELEPQPRYVTRDYAILPDARVRSMLEKLLKKSQSNEVNWHEIPRQSASREQREACGVDLRDYAIKLEFFIPPAEPDYFKISITGGGKPIIEWTMADDGNADEEFNLAQSLFLDAKRTVQGWDDIIEEINAILDREGPVGAIRR